MTKYVDFINGNDLHGDGSKELPFKNTGEATWKRNAGRFIAGANSGSINISNTPALDLETDFSVGVTVYDYNKSGVLACKGTMAGEWGMEIVNGNIRVRIDNKKNYITQGTVKYGDKVDFNFSAGALLVNFNGVPQQVTKTQDDAIVSIVTTTSNIYLANDISGGDSTQFDGVIGDFYINDVANGDLLVEYRFNRPWQVNSTITPDLYDSSANFNTGDLVDKDTWIKGVVENSALEGGNFTNRQFGASCGNAETLNAETELDIEFVVENLTDGDIAGKWDVDKGSWQIRVLNKAFLIEFSDNNANVKYKATTDVLPEYIEYNPFAPLGPVIEYNCRMLFNKGAITFWANDVELALTVIVDYEIEKLSVNDAELFVGQNENNPQPALDVLAMNDIEDISGSGVAPTFARDSSRTVQDCYGETVLIGNDVQPFDGARYSGSGGEFNGVDSFLDCGNGDELQLTDNIKIEVKVATIIGSGNRKLVSKQTNFATNNAFHLNVMNDGRLEIYVSSAPSATGNRKVYYYPIVNNNTKISFTFVSGVITVTYDNVEQVANKSIDDPIATIYNSPEPVNIGSGNGTDFYNGTISDVKITNLSTGQVVLDMPMKDDFKDHSQFYHHVVNKKVVFADTKINRTKQTLIPIKVKGGIFNGTTSNLNYGSPSKFNFSNNFKITARIARYVTGADYTIIGKGDTSTNDFAYGLNVFADGKFGLTTSGNGTVFTLKDVRSDIVVKTGDLISAEFNDGTVELFVNGVKDDNAIIKIPNAHTSIFTGSSDTIVSNNNQQGYFDGTLSDLDIRNTLTGDVYLSVAMADGFDDLSVDSATVVNTDVTQREVTVPAGDFEFIEDAEWKGYSPNAQGTNLVINSETPANQNITTTIGQTYTLSVKDGSATAEGNVATVGNPQTYVSTLASTPVAFSSAIEPQFELSPFQTSYIPTYGSAVTRIADSLSYNTQGSWLEGRAVKFDASKSQYIDCGNDASLQLTDNIMVQVQLLTITGTGTRVICAKRGAGGVAFWFLITSTNLMEVLISDDGTFGAGHLKNYRSPSPVVDNNLLAFSFETGVFRLYIDGVEITPTKVNDDPITSIYNTTEPFSIGAYNLSTTPVGFFDGNISGTSITDLSTGNYVGYWPLEDDSGPTVYDVGPSSNHGTISPGTGTILEMRDAKQDKTSYPSINGYTDNAGVIVPALLGSRTTDASGGTLGVPYPLRYSSEFVNGAQGTVICEIKTGKVDFQQTIIGDLFPAIIGISDAGKFRIFDGINPESLSDTFTFLENQSYKIALQWRDKDFTVYVDGVYVDFADTTYRGWNIPDMSVGRSGDLDFFSGYVKDLLTYNMALSDAYLIKATT